MPLLKLQKSSAAPNVIKKGERAPLRQQETRPLTSHRVQVSFSISLKIVRLLLHAAQSFISKTKVGKMSAAVTILRAGRRLLGDGD